MAGGPLQHVVHQLPGLHRLVQAPLGQPGGDVRVVRLFLVGGFQFLHGHRLLVGRGLLRHVFQNLVNVLPVALLEGRLADADALQRSVCVQPLLVGGEQLAHNLLAVGLDEVFDVDVALAVRQGPIARVFRPDEPEHHRVQVEQRPLGPAVAEDREPVLRPGQVLGADGQPLGQPVWAEEVGLGQVEDVGQLVLDHPAPVERLA